MKNPNSFSVFIKTSSRDVANIKHCLDRHKFNLEEIDWLKIKDKNSFFFKIEFRDISLEKFMKLCNKLKSHIDIEQIEIRFKSRRNCLQLLQDKGFSKYEEIDYVDFRYEKKNVIIIVMKEDGLYKLMLHVIDGDKEIDLSYLQRLINRVFEIIGEGELK